MRICPEWDKSHGTAASPPKKNTTAKCKSTRKTPNALFWITLQLPRELKLFTSASTLYGMRVKGIPNFFHILLTIGNLLISQIERIIAALETEDKLVISPDRWHQVRDNLDSYYRVLAELFEMTAVDYLDSLLDASSPSKISREFLESLPDLNALSQRALANRDRLILLQQTRLVVMTVAGPITGLGFFNSLLSPAKWSGFANRLGGFQDQLRSRLAA